MVFRRVGPYVFRPDDRCCSLICQRTNKVFRQAVLYVFRQAVQHCSQFLRRMRIFFRPVSPTCFLQRVRLRNQICALVLACCLPWVVRPRCAYCDGVFRIVAFSMPQSQPVWLRRVCVVFFRPVDGRSFVLRSFSAFLAGKDTKKAGDKLIGISKSRYKPK